MSIKQELEQELNKLKALEEAIDNDLDMYISVITSGKSLSRNVTYESSDVKYHVGKIEQLQPLFEVILEDSKKLMNQVSECQNLSDRLSLLVRRLDIIQIRSQQALACTEDVINLKECNSALLNAIENLDLITAVGLIKQINDIDDEAARSSDEYGSIQQAKRDVRQLVQKEFDNAIVNSDLGNIVKLCPLLQTVGLENEARDLFLNFMESNVFIAMSADAAPIDHVTDAATAYAQTLTSIFNSAYIICQQYLPIVIQGMEKSFADIYFIQKLHKKCEVESGSVLKRYMKFRNMKAIIKSISSDNSSASLSSTNISSPPPSSSGSGNSCTSAEMHCWLDEIALLLQYCNSYKLFLNMICNGAETRIRQVHQVQVGHNTIQTKDKFVGKIFPGATDFDRMTDELINKYYLEGEKWLIVQGLKLFITSLSAKTGSVVDTGDTSGGNNQIDVMDGCFYVLQRCSQRSLTLANIHAACAALHLISDHISTDLLKALTDKMNVAVGKISNVLKDNIQRFLRVSCESSSSNTTSTSSNISTAGSTLSLGIQSALSMASTITSSSSSLQKSREVPSLPEVGSPIGSDGVWGMASHMEIFNLVELCLQYTESLKRDIIQTGKSVFDGNRNETKPPSDEYQKFCLCVEDFTNCAEQFSQVINISSAILPATYYLISSTFFPFLYYRH